MTQAELDREVSAAIGESLATVRRRGFSLVVMPEREPLTVDWDTLDAERVSLLPDLSRRRVAA